MTQRSLSTPNSGLRVFSACLLSSLLIMMPFVQLAAAEKRAEGRGQRLESRQQAAEGRQQDNAKNAAAENVFLNAPIPKAAPEPLVGPVIVATKDDGLATATTVAPGGTINYSVNIKNNGTVSPADDATGVTFTDMIDSHTTLVVDSAVAAVSDKYNAIGNVRLSIPDGSTDLLANDIDPDTGNNNLMTVTAETKSSTQCTGGCSNNVTINSDGSFTYDPPVGFAGTDTFTYTAHSTAGPGTATETVTITVANEIWFINNNAGACPGAPCDGRLSHPFTSLAAFTAANDGAAGHPGDNDWIFIYESATEYAGPATLRNGQKFIGQDATASLATLTSFPAASGTDQLPVMNSGNGTFVNITGANVNGINLASGNTLRGFRVGDVGTGTKISGTSFGTLTVGNNSSPDVTLNGTGRTLNLVTGTFAATSGFVSVASTSMTGQGMTLTSVGGTVSFGSTTISNASTQCMQVSTSTANINFGNTSCSGVGSEGVVLSSNGAGTRTFGTLSITGATAGGFIYSGSGSGGGDINVTGAATINVAGNAISVSAPVSGDLIDFQAATSATTSGLNVAGVFYSGAAGAELKFNSLSIQRNNGTALDASGGGTVTVTNGTGSINNTTAGGPAIVATGIALNANFSSINSSGGNNGVILTTVTGTSNFGGGQLTGTSGGATFQVAGGTASVTYSGNITQGAAAAMVSISNHATGTILFQTGTLLASLGTGLVFNNADGTYNFNGTNTISGSNAHVQITNGSAGTFNFSSNTAVTNPSAAPAFDVSGGSASAPNITYSGTLTQNTAAQRAINISGISGGTETFSGAITSNGGAGVSIEGTGGTVNISGNMTLNNTASVYKACSGTCASPSGTGLHITVTGSNNTVGATTAAATRGVQIDGAQIDAGGVTFKSIAVNGSTNEGILVNNTGSSGFFTVVGNGSAGTGGTIQNVTNRGASFITTRNITLNWMNFTNANTADGAVSNGTVGGNENTDENGAIHLSAVTNASLSNITISGTTSQHGINGNNVTNLDLTNITVNTAGDEVWESGIYLFHLKGVPSASQDSIWDNVDINDTGQFNVSIINASGTNAQPAEKDKLTIQNGSSFKNSGKNVIGDHISNFNSVTANFQIVVNAATFDSKINGEYVGAHTSDGIQVDVSGASARFDATITGCTFTSTTGGGVGQSAINISSTTGAGTFNVTNNTATVRQGAGINIAVTGTAALTGHITGNTLSTNITNNPSYGINMVTEGNGSMIVDVQNNSIQGSGSGIGTTTAFDHGIRGGARAGTGSAQFVIKGNTVQTAKSSGTWLFAGNNTAGETSTTCVNFSTGNTIDADFPTQAFTEYFLEQYTNTTFRIQGLVGSGTNAANVEAYVASTDLDPSPTDPNVSAGGGTVVNYSNAVCSTAPLLLAEGGIESALPSGCSGSAPFAIDAQVDQSNELSLVGFLGANSTPEMPTTVSTSLTNDGLDTIVSAAKERWLRSGLSNSQSNVVANLMFEIGDLADGFLGEANGNRILVDRDAQGKGWFIDNTPANDFEFGERISATRSYTNPFTSAAGRIDLLTAIEHEIGHRLGLSDSYSENDRDSIMYGYLAVGERRVPATGQAANAQAGLRGKHFLRLEEEKASDTKQQAASRRNHAATSHAVTAPVVVDTVTANIGNLPAGGSVTITFQVTVNNPPNLTLLNPPRVENQGTVSGNFTSVLTDDPNVIGAADKTATQIDLFNTTTSLGSNLNPSNDGDTVTFTATVTENPDQLSANPTGTVDFINTNHGNAVICDNVPLSGGSAPCAVSNLTAGQTHDIRADYSGDGNFDGSQSNIVNQVVNACVINPVVTTTADSGAGSLREALATVCSAPNNNITFNIPDADPGHVLNVYTITLLTELTINKSLNITGPNSVTNTDPIVVSGNNVTRIFTTTNSSTVSISGLTLTGGNGAGTIGNTRGGAVYADGGTLTLDKLHFTGNGALFGAGAFFEGGNNHRILNSTFSSNTASGSGGSGGGFCTSGAGLNLLIANSTFSGNSQTDNGGTGGAGCVTNFSNVHLQNVTISGNSAVFNAGGLSVGGPGATMTMANSIIAGNTASIRPEIFNNGTVTSAGNNLVGDSSGDAGNTFNPITYQASDILDTPPLLGPLQNNGGTTPTLALLAGSPAIEKGNNCVFDNTCSPLVGFAITTDQRGTGYPRIADSSDAANTTDTVDIGAYEAHPTLENIADKTTAEDTAFNFDFNLGDDSASLITSVVATSDNQTLVPDANLVETDGTANDGVWNLSITPAANANSPADGTATITVTVTAANGRTAVDTFVVTVTEVNDAPVPTNDTVGDIGEDCSSGCTGPVYVIPFATLLTNDTNKGAANESGQTLDITAVSSPTGGSAVINGTNVEFTPTANFSGAAGFTYTVTDNGTTNAVSDPQAGNATVSFNITAVNDPPSFTIAGDPPAVNEDAGAQTVNSFATSISAGPGETQTLTFNLTPTGTTGNLTFASGPAIDSTTGNLTYTSNADTNGTASFSVTLSDNGGGTDTSAPQSFTITVNAVDDAPTFTLAAGPTVAEDAGAQSVPGFASNFQPGPVTATDESTQTLVGYTLTATGTTGGLTFSATPAIDTAGALTFTATGDSSGTATFDVVATDTGSNTPPNVNQSAPQSFTITVTAANDGPVNTVPGSQGTPSNTPLTFSSGNGNQVSVADADAGTNPIKVTLTVTNGTLTLNGTTGLDFSGTCSGAAGDGTADATMTFCGTITNINNALNGMTYTPNLGYSGPATLTITSNDQGNTGTGGAQSDTDVVNIQVATEITVNDASVVEPAQPNTIDMVFTVSLNSPAPAGGVTVNFQTNNGTALSGTCPPVGSGDYTSTSGQVNFAVGEQVKTINVPVCGDSVADDGETFTVTLSSPVNGTIVDGTATGTITGNTAGTVLISELRTSGPGGAGDDFVEIYNNSNSPLTVAASDTSAGYGLYKMGADCNATPVLIGVIPNGTVIPARGHYLFVGSAYSLTNYGGTGAAAGNLTLSANIETDGNVGVFSTSNVAAISSVNRLDAVGFGLNTGGVCDLLREGSTLPSVAGNPLTEHSFFRKMCDFVGGVGCSTPGIPKDTNQNAADFLLADTLATDFITSRRLGAPGPENITSPIRRDNTGIDVVLLDGAVASAAHPNRSRSFTSDPPNNSTFGTMTIRRRVINNTGSNVTRLRFRIVEMTTFPTPAGTADLRARTGTVETSFGPINDSVTCATTGTPTSSPCNVTVQATTLEIPPVQPNGGGLNSTLSAGTITLAQPLANGASINVNFLLGIQQTGTFRFLIIVEALP